MAKSHASDNPSRNKPLTRFFGNENPATGKPFVSQTAGASSKAKTAMSRFMATTKGGKKR